ncbi:hypothetical protein E2C01_102827 [Portunus trituberculatus]|uniref:Uncharacterized protein n=1 Tax=Portunus trituberculatus TaxID=210409 RepID=A0A5B7KNG4_PORTR|nr:hypothetical protein [Portunus trituberculatus]
MEKNIRKTPRSHQYLLRPPDCKLKVSPWSSTNATIVGRSRGRLREVGREAGQVSSWAVSSAGR